MNDITNDITTHAVLCHSIIQQESQHDAAAHDSMRMLPCMIHARDVIMSRDASWGCDSAARDVAECGHVV